MQIECLKDILQEKISLLQGSISKNLTLPILNNILIQTDNGRIKLATTNLEIGMIAWIGGKIINPGEITVPLKPLIGILNNISSEKVILKLEKDNLIIEGGSFKISLKGMAGKDFPIIPKVENGIEFKMSAEKFKKAVLKILPAVSISETRPELTGVLIELIEKRLNFVGTDGFHLAKTAIVVETNEVRDDFNIIAPAKTITEAVKCIGNSSGEILIRISESQILFNLNNNISVISRIIEGQYPPYKEIMPNNIGTKLFLNKDELLKSVKMAGIFTPVKSMEISFSQKDDNNVEIQSSSSEIGENSSILKADIQGNKINQFTFNYRYLLDGISQVDSDNVCFSINDTNTPIIITSDKEDENNFLYLMMPLK
ncbi:MAG: DNA polymerase III subunit beta [bacterium]